MKQVTMDMYIHASISDNRVVAKTMDGIDGGDRK